MSRRPSSIDHPSYTHAAIDLARPGFLADRIPELVGGLLDEPGLSRLALVNNAADPGLLGQLAQVDAEAMGRVRAVNVAAPVWLMGWILAAELEISPGFDGDVTILSYGPGPVDTPMQAAARSTPTDRFPLLEIFREWASDGHLMAPSVPAAEIAAYLEDDEYPRFHECRSGEVHKPRPAS